MAKRFALGADIKAIPAPLAGVTDPAYRKALSECCCSLIATEMISAEGIIREHRKTLEFIDDDDVHPLVVQIFGSNPLSMARAAKIVEKLGADMIDINMGCPTKKIVASGSGLALMRNPEKAREIILAVREAAMVPVSVKVRLGWQEDFRTVENFAVMAGEMELHHITVHGRYRNGYDTPADWESIRQVKEMSSAPVVGNGDIFQIDDAKRMLAITGCDAVMIGRGIMGNPWLIPRIERYLKDGDMPEPVCLAQRMIMFKKHLEWLVRKNGPKRASFIFRKHAAWYLKGIDNGPRRRKEVFSFESPDSYYRLADELLAR